MDTVHNAIAWYQKKIGSYDKQLWEESVEKKLLKVPPNVKNAPKKSVRLKTEYIDVDLIRGSTFTKTKPQVPWIYITRKAIARVIFFPFYYKWWVLQTSVKLYLLLLVLYVLQVISIIVYLRNLDHSIVEDELSFTEVTLPVILMFLLCLVHSQTVLAHITHKPPKRTKTIPRVIRPQKTKKATRKGHRSSGNNSSACQDDSCTSSRSAKANQVGKREPDASSSTSKQQISQDGSFSFPDVSQSTIKTGSSSDSTYSSLSKSEKNSKDARRSSAKRGHIFDITSQPQKGADVVNKKAEKKGQGGDGCFDSPSTSDKIQDETNTSGVREGGNRIDRDCSLGFEPTEIDSRDGKEGMIGEGAVGDAAKENSSNRLSASSALADASSLVVETLKCGMCGQKKCDVSMVTGDDSLGYHMQQRPDHSEIGNICDDCNGRPQKGSRLIEHERDFKVCSCTSSSNAGLKCNTSHIENSSPLSNERHEASLSGAKVFNGNERQYPCCSHHLSQSCDLQCSASNASTQFTTSPLQSPTDEKNDGDDSSRDYSYHYYGNTVTEDSGIHSNLSSAESVASGLGMELSSPSSANGHQSTECTDSTAISQIHSSCLSNGDGEGDNLSPSVSTSSSSPSTQRENVHHRINNANLIHSTATTKIVATASNSSIPSCQNCATNECDNTTEIDLKDLEKQPPCSSQTVNHHCHHHHHHHLHHQTQVPPSTTTPVVSPSTSSSTHSTSTSSSCGIQCFSEQFAHEILNSETLREVSSTILMNNSDLDCSSSSVTGPLSSASFSSSSSAFSTNNMFSLPVKEPSSCTLTADVQPTDSLISKSSKTPITDINTIATTTAINPSNAQSTCVANSNDDDNNVIAAITTTASTNTPIPATFNSPAYLSLPKRRHFANRLPINQQRQKGKVQHQNVTSCVNDNDDEDANLEKLIEIDSMEAVATTTSDVERMSDISNYSPSESDSDIAETEELRNRCEEKRRKQLRFQELNVHAGASGGGINLSGGSPKPGTPTSANASSRSVVNALTRKPSPLKDLTLPRKLNAGAVAQASTHSSASDVGKSESTTRSCLRRRRRTSGNTGDVDTTRTRSVPSSIGIGGQDKNKAISSSENEGGEGYAAEGSNKATMSSEEWEDRIPLDESTSSNYSSSCENSDSEVTTRDGDDVEEEEEEKTEYTTSTLHVINLLQPQAGSPSNSGNVSQPDKVSCLIWEMNECKKVDLTALDIGWAIIDKVDSLPESSDYFIIGMLFSVFMGIVPLAFRGFVNKSWTNMEELLSWSGLVNKTLDIPNWFMLYTWRQNLLMFNGILQRFFLSLLFFFLLSVADRTFKQRLLYAKHFSYLTSSRRARKFSMPHFRLNKVRNIKIWLSLRSYLKRRGPQRSVDVIVSASFMCGISVVCLISLQMLKDSGNYLDFLCNWEMLVWCLALAVYLLRFMTLGLKINKKYRNLSVLITEQINLYLQMEQKPHKKEELVLANNVLRLAEDLLKELESPFKISGFSANPFIYNITKVIVLSAFSAVLTELLGFKLKLHKIKLKG